jgi:pyruvyltransferase
MPSIDIYAWNPRAPLSEGRFGRHLRLRRRVNNFGDLIGPLIVDGMRERLALAHRPATRSTQLLTVGSVVHAARPNAVIWGSGVNGRFAPGRYRVRNLDVRAVRGPLSRDFLRDLGIEVPPVFGDPALQLPRFRPDLTRVPKEVRVTAIPNLNEVREPEWQRARQRSDVRYLDPRSALETCLQVIAASELVVGSSLHAVIVAEALGVPARLVTPTVEPIFKYTDYYSGTGRPSFTPARTVDDALLLGGEPSPDWDPEPLVASFPSDIWTGERS